MKKLTNILILTAVIFATPLLTFASTADIDTSSLSTKSTKPYLNGTASDTKFIKFIIFKEGSTKSIFKSKNIKVKNDKWKSKVSKKLTDGKYQVELFDSKKTSGTPTETYTLTINKKGNFTSENTSKTTLEVKSVPLLFGGNAKPGSEVAISYLQITNTGSENATLNGFWIKQNGSAPDSSISGLTTVDDKGELRGFTQTSSPFKKGIAFAPTSANIIFTPGQTRLFTIKAILSSEAYLYNSKSLSIDVTSIDTNSSIKGMFPIKGTTWTIAN